MVVPTVVGAADDLRMRTSDMNIARSLWLRMETIHAVTYFAPESAQAAAAAGLSGFWMGYFGFRAAPMGPVGAGVVEATFFNFATAFVQRWIPQVWQHATPHTLINARSAAAAATLTRLYPEVADVAHIVNPTLEQAVGRAVAAGRPLFAANRLLPCPEDPTTALWHWCTCLREHRGDGHVSALTASGLDGLQAHILIATEQNNSPEDLQQTRGWTSPEWDDAVQRCTKDGLIADGTLTARGHELRSSVEATTDRLAFEPFAALAPAQLHELINALHPLAHAVSISGTIRYPNPMGLSAIA